MSTTTERIVHVSDTALMVAACRALETARPDGFVRDPFAERLAGERGMAIAHALPRIQIMCFGIGVRSRLMDNLIQECVREQGVRTVLSLGCGLDTRPWRLDLPRELRWIEADFAALLEYKTSVMTNEALAVQLEQMPIDLNDADQRSKLFRAASDTPALMITEGLLMYLPGATVEALASESGARSGVRYWLSDITSPAFARMVGMDAYAEIHKVRSEGHMNGLQILDVMNHNRWEMFRSKRYLTDLFDFAGPRMLAAREARQQAGLPDPPAPPADDPTGVHLLRLS